MTRRERPWAVVLRPWPTPDGWEGNVLDTFSTEEKAEELHDAFAGISGLEVWITYKGERR